MPEVRLIDSETLKSRIGELCINNDDLFSAKAYERIIGVIEAAPTIEAAPVRHGRWIPTEYDSYYGDAPIWDKYECSECGHEHSGEEDTLTAFCPDCGARMDEPPESEVQDDA